MSRLALIVAGGTGGHLYPGIALARTMSERGWSVRFAVRRGDLGKDILAREGFTVYELAGQGLPRRLSMDMLRFPVRFAQGAFEAGKLLGQLRPQVVIGMGGYLSFSVLLGARLSGIPTMIHEQNVLPGLSNRLLSMIVKSVAVSFEGSLKRLTGKKVWVSGLPVRKEIGLIGTAEARLRFGLDPKRRTYLVFGGSQGAQRLNSTMPLAFKRLAQRKKDFQVLHITGPNALERTQKVYKDEGVEAQLLPYCHDMAAAYGAADLVVCRAGASTVAELLAARRPALLVPYPFASENHQVFNAQVMERLGVGITLLESVLTADRVVETLSILQSKEAGMMKSFGLLGAEDPRDASDRLADGVEGLL